MNADTAHNETWKETVNNLLHQYETGSEGFLTKFLTGDETWFHFFNPNSSRNHWNGDI
jgi:hypothetical protein